MSFINIQNCVHVKSNSETHNYIHNLFLYEFSVPFEVSRLVRTKLNSNFTKYRLYFNWIHHYTSKTSIPRFEKNNTFILCENVDEIELFEKWYHGNASCPTSKYVWINVKYLELRIAFYGKIHSREFRLRYQYYDSFLFTEHQCKHRVDGPIVTKLTEEVFYQKIQELLEILISTNKIPFEFYGVK